MYKNKKIVLLGDSAVGKTSIALRFINKNFKDHIESTIGAAFFSKKISAKDGIKDIIEIWDTAGQERYKALVPMYYREAAGAIIVYDVTCNNSLENAKDWILNVRQKGPEKIKIVLVGNKSDLLDNTEIWKSNLEKAKEYIDIKERRIDKEPQSKGEAA